MDGNDLDRDSVARWVREATESLPPEECDRVCAFLMEHYANALDKDWKWSSSTILSDIIHRRILSAARCDGAETAQLYPVLRRWLNIASDGLCADARDRVAREVSAHFVDALQDGLANGLDAASARDHAILGLGSPRAARRAYRRTFLTTREEGQVEMLLGMGRPGRRQFVSSLCGCLIVALQWCDRSLSTPFVTGATAAVVIHLCTNTVLTPKLVRANPRKWGFILNAVTSTAAWWAISTVYCVNLWPRLSNPDKGILLVSIQVAFAWLTYLYFRIYQKLGADGRKEPAP